MSLRQVPKGPLREGFTTGTSATAAAKAALTALLAQKMQQHVQVHLPIGQVLDIDVHTCAYEEAWAKCTVIKDAGDDPDVTHGAEIGCEIRLSPDKEIYFKRGEGLGIVTLPGLELNVGEAAINPVPRRMMKNALVKLLHDFDRDCGVIATVFIINGEAIAKKTLNERVGIMEGLSILGTTGIVKPYSAASYIASIVQGIDVAVANGVRELVLNSGARSEKYLKAYFPRHSEQAFIHYGNWIGETLIKVRDSPIRKVSIGIMLGKAVKLAEGRTDTHSCVSSWNKAFIQGLALASGHTQERANLILGLTMAGRLVELFAFEDTEPIYQTLLAQCYRVCKNKLGRTDLDIYLVGKEGEIIQHKKT